MCSNHFLETAEERDKKNVQNCKHWNNWRETTARTTQNKLWGCNVSNYEIFHQHFKPVSGCAHRVTSFQFRLINSTFLEKKRELNNQLTRTTIQHLNGKDVIIWNALVMMPSCWDADLCRKSDEVSLCDGQEMFMNFKRKKSLPHQKSINNPDKRKLPIIKHSLSKWKTFLCRTLNPIFNWFMADHFNGWWSDCNHEFDGWVCTIFQELAHFWRYWAVNHLSISLFGWAINELFFFHWKYKFR